MSLDSEAGRIDPTTVFDNARQRLVTDAGATDLTVTDGMVCRHPSNDGVWVTLLCGPIGRPGADSAHGARITAMVVLKTALNHTCRPR